MDERSSTKRRRLSSKQPPPKQYISRTSASPIICGQCPSNYGKLYEFVCDLASSSRQAAWPFTSQQLSEFLAIIAVNPTIRMDCLKRVLQPGNPFLGVLSECCSTVLESFCKAFETENTECASGVVASGKLQVQLAYTVCKLCRLVIDLLCEDTVAETIHARKALADTLLRSRDIASLLLRAAALPLLNQAWPDLSHRRYIVLQAERRACVLLASLLEEATQKVRHQFESLLLSAQFEPGGTRLVDALVRGWPDLELHEALLELLWRGLRRSQHDPQFNELAAVKVLKSLVGEIAFQRLCALQAQDILDWAWELCLQLNEWSGEVVLLTNCMIVWGGFRLAQCDVLFTVGGLLVEGQCDMGRSCTIEIPCSLMQCRDLAIRDDNSMHLRVQTRMLDSSQLPQRLIPAVQAKPHEKIIIHSSADAFASDCLSRLRTLLGVGDESPYLVVTLFINRCQFKGLSRLHCVSIGGNTLASFQAKLEDVTLADLYTALADRLNVSQQALQLVLPNGVQLQRCDEEEQLSELFKEHCGPSSESHRSHNIPECALTWQSTSDSSFADRSRPCGSHGAECA